MAPSRSPLWQYFESVSLDNLMVGRCKTCQKEIKTKNWSLTGLRKHLQCKHPELHQELCRERAVIDTTENEEEQLEGEAEIENDIEAATKSTQEKTKMDKISLAQNEFPQETLNVFKELLNDTHFTNVTLVTDGNNYIKAHKVILSAFSPIFKDILVNNPQDNPVIYLRGVAHQHLKAIIKYIYLGETKVSLESVTEFLNVASDLNIVGLGVDKMLNSNENKGKHSDENEYLTSALNLETEMSDEVFEEKHPTSPNHLMTKLDEDSPKTKTTKYICNICEYETKKKFNLKEHKESVHACLKYQCDVCEHMASTRNNLKKHSARVHQQTYPSNQVLSCNLKSFDK